MVILMVILMNQHYPEIKYIINTESKEIIQIISKINYPEQKSIQINTNNIKFKSINKWEI